jgi:hypothetical protein
MVMVSPSEMLTTFPIIAELKDEFRREKIMKWIIQGWALLF